MKFNFDDFGWSEWVVLKVIPEMQQSRKDEVLYEFKERIARRQSSPTRKEILEFDDEITSEDVYLLRFLVESNNKIDLAEDLLVQSVNWRRENNMKDIRYMTETEVLGGVDPSNVFSFYPSFQYGFDREDRPVVYMHAGRQNGAKVVELIGIEGFMRWHAWKFEQVIKLNRKRSEQLGKRIDDFVYVQDLRGGGPRMLTPAFIKIIKAQLKIENIYYPQRIKSIFITRPPLGFSSMFGLIKSFLSEEIQKKIRVCSNEKELLESLDESQLPGTVKSRKELGVVPMEYPGYFVKRDDASTSSDVTGDARDVEDVISHNKHVENIPLESPPFVQCAKRPLGNHSLVDHSVKEIPKQAVEIMDVPIKVRDRIPKPTLLVYMVLGLLWTFFALAFKCMIALSSNSGLITWSAFRMRGALSLSIISFLSVTFVLTVHTKKKIEYYCAIYDYFCLY